MVIEITDDRQILFEIPRDTIATDLKLNTIGLALDSTKVRGQLNSPPRDYDTFHAFAVEQNSENYGTTVSIEILTPTRIIARVPTKDFGDFLGAYDTGGCERLTLSDSN